MIIVGIGASAGGLEALERMFDEIPKDCGMAFVIVQHLSPDFRSLMVELLGRHTKMATHRVTDHMVVEPNSVYLIPPKQDMIIEDGKLLLTERAASPSPSLPIDLFLKSLAVDRGKNSVGVILSGTGSDGSRGVKEIHDAGGLVVVQTPNSAKFDGMPKSAINTDYADIVTSPEKISAILKLYCTEPDRVALRNKVLPVLESSLERIFRAIQKRHRIDFSQYRPTTIERRIERRVEMDTSIDSLSQYVDLLEQDDVELDRLHSDLLIGVTSFFRDIRPFESVKQNSLKKLLGDHPDGEEFRVWVAACATGEEAYSVAILIAECLQETPRSIDVKVFATDIHQAAINKATEGVYTKELLQGVSERRLNRFFNRVDGGFQIAPGIRQMVVFAPHNLVNDPPFTRLSLVTCRNFLIYLKPTAQKKVISHFHFSLKKNGYMLLGSSESPGELSGEFESVDAHNRLYMKTREAPLRAPLFTQGLIRNPPPVGRYFPLSHTKTLPKDNPLLLSNEEILTNLVPPGIVVDSLGQVLQVFRNGGKYLQVGDGVLTSNLMDMVDGDLRLAIGGAIQRSTKRREPVCYERLRIKINSGEFKQVRLTVTPLIKNDLPKKYVITFDQLQSDDTTDALSEHTGRLELGEISKNHMEGLEKELRNSREILQATTEEMETSNEELQATNEELVASNEELQAANEELHSVNEELFTVNGEYQRKISELTELTNDFDHLLESTEIHTLFLDQGLCIRKFTPHIAEVLHLVPHDIGRKVDAFVHNIKSVDLSEKIATVLKTGELWEERIEDGTSTEYLLRVLPYKAGGSISGVVLTLIDISKLAAAQAAVTLERERFARAIVANRDGTWDWPDLNQDEMWWSSTCYQILGYEPDSFPATHSQWLSLIHPEDREKISRTSVPSADKCYVEIHENFDYRMKHKSGEYRWYCHRAIVDHDSNGKAIRMTGSIADVQDRKASEVLANEGIRLRDNFLSMLSHELRNPVGAVMSAMRNLDDVIQENPKLGGQPELAVINRQTKHMARLLDDLLDVARFGQDKIEFRKEIVDVCELVNSVIETVDHQLEKKQQVLEASICEGPLNIIGDPSRIAQAQTNLIVNASKFSDQGQVITYTIQKEPNEAVITVGDEGLGIAPEILERVFDLFVQCDNTLHRTAGGMGVGLSLTQKIVHAHNGTISAQSAGRGHGSSFQLRLPLTSLSHQKRDKTQTFDRDRTCKVMLVEDNRDAREMLANTFERRGFEVLAVDNGKTAIKEFPKFAPAVAVVDIGLPGITGFEIAKTIRQNALWDQVLLVALTGYGQQEDKDAIAASGFDHHIVKPLNFSDLRKLIVKHLSGREEA